MEIKPIIYDIECYPNYFMVGYSLCKNIVNDKGEHTGFTFERHYADTRDMTILVKVLERFYKLKDEIVFIGFNNNNYDKVILQEAYINRTMSKEKLTEHLFKITQQIINEEFNSFKYKMFVQYDLQNDPSQSLKSSGVIIHHDTIQELPYEPTKILTDKEIEQVVIYNQDNDLSITEQLLNIFFGKFKALQQVIETFDLPITAYSFTERQLTENVLCSPSAMGNPTMTTTYKCPIEFTYKDNKLNEIKRLYENTIYKFGDNFSQEIEYKHLKITFALGGLHSSIPQYEGKNLIDIDVASYYPNLIRRFDLLPLSVKDKDSYYQMITDRVKLKKTDPAKATAYKIILNATYGALGYANKDGKVGKMFDFNKLLLTTITGQLLIMKLVEDLTENGYKVVYINTDGLMIENNGSDKYKEIIKNWEQWTSLSLEENEVVYCSMKDVNNYILKEKDKDNFKIKAKGVFNLDIKSINTLTSNYAKRRISIQAVINKVLYDKPIEDTIKESKDIRDFVLHWKFGSQYINRELNGKPLGRIVRWYISNSKKNKISSLNSNTNTQYTPAFANNVVLINKLSDYDNNLPSDIDYDWYINEAYSLYKDLTGKHIIGNINAINMYNELLDKLDLKGKI